MAAGQRDAAYQRNAQRQRQSNLESLAALAGKKLLLALQKVVGRVVDTGTRHQREDTRQQENRHRGLVVDGEEPRTGGQRQGGRQCGNGRAHAEQLHAEDVYHPAHRAGQTGGQIVPPRHLKGNAEADGGNDHHHKMGKVVRPCRHHTATPSPRARIQPSTTPPAMLPAMNRASNRRMEPER